MTHCIQKRYENYRFAFKTLNDIAKQFEIFVI